MSMLQLFLPLSTNYKSGPTGLEAFLIFSIAFGLPALAIIISYIYNHIYIRSVIARKFALKSRFNQDNLLVAYIVLSAKLIKKDNIDSGEKILYMKSYFSRYFNDQYFDFGDVLSTAIKNEFPLIRIGKWLSYNLNTSDRLQVMYFLTGLTLVDGKIMKGEYNLLNELSVLIEISPKEFQSIIGMYKQQEEQKHKKKPTISRNSNLKLASEIIGVSEHANMDEIKKAYRKLVKLHHPDRFFNQSEGQQRIAKERFMEIQKAYEILEKIK